MTDTPSWRPMAPADLPAMLAIADIVHPAYPEDAAVFEERLALYPDGCLVLEMSGRPVGYIVSHPWAGAPPKLNSMLGALPVNPATYYIHDIALLPETRGTGAAASVVEHLAKHATAYGFPTMSLTAVNASVPFWERQGFRVIADPALEAGLRSYDASACFMVRDLPKGA